MTAKKLGLVADQNSQICKLLELLFATVECPPAVKEIGSSKF
jgi:hypothetical protein